MPPKKPGMEDTEDTRFDTYGEEQKRTRKNVKAGLILPVARIFGHLKTMRVAERVSTEGAVSIASVLEYLITEILELSGNVCLDSSQENKLKVIKPKHIMLAIRQDNDLMQTIGEFIVSNSGNVRDVLSELKKEKDIKSM